MKKRDEEYNYKCQKCNNYTSIYLDRAYNHASGMARGYKLEIARNKLCLTCNSDYLQFYKKSLTGYYNEVDNLIKSIILESYLENTILNLQEIKRIYMEYQSKYREIFDYLKLFDATKCDKGYIDARDFAIKMIIINM